MSQVDFGDAKLTDDDESPEFWFNSQHTDLATRCAVLHAQRRELIESHAAIQIQAVSGALADIYITGNGVELGAGTRLFQIPYHAKCCYGDVRNQAKLAKYFGTEEVALHGHIDAQTIIAVAKSSLDFCISGHVTEHLENPIGSIRAAIDSLKSNGILLLVALEMSKTWDRTRPQTTLSHCLQDDSDGRVTASVAAYVEHVKYVYPITTGQHFPEEEIELRALAITGADMNIDFHAWSFSNFLEMLMHLNPSLGFRIECLLTVANESCFMMRRIS